MCSNNGTGIKAPFEYLLGKCCLEKRRGKPWPPPAKLQKEEGEEINIVSLWAVLKNFCLSCICTVGKGERSPFIAFCVAVHCAQSPQKGIKEYKSKVKREGNGTKWPSISQSLPFLE